MQDRNVALPDEALTAFMAHCSKRIGDAYFRTPRNTITAFVNMLAVLAQNPSVDWRSLIGTVDVGKDIDSVIGETSDDGTDDELASFKL